MNLPDSGAAEIPGGTSFAQYRILRKLGQGGMGEVYLAVDTQLGRRVALKFLREKLHTDKVARKRLLAEARAAASVDHPYICKIYEVGDVAGTLFISMEFVEGETLAERISNIGPHSINELLRIACEIAEALQKAHSRRLIHRDLKPSNILLTPEGHVKITDFGLAMHITDVDNETLTLIADTVLSEPGILFGTPAYMSPEQARGLAADARSDLFSFGVIVYELLTGTHPFKRNTPATTLVAVVTEPPPRHTRKDCPDSLQMIIDRLLAKEPTSRYQSAQGALRDLNDLREGRAIVASASASDAAHSISRASDANSLAVLPFANLSADKENEFFSDGVTEELIARIGMIRGLKVISRTSVMRYKASQLSLASIARELGVANVLEGSVQRLGSRVRIVARLVEVERGHQVWSEIYDRDLSDILAVQADVCRQICEALSANVSMSISEVQRLERGGAVNADAYTCYLKGRHFLNKLTPESTRKGIGYFQAALDHDPAFANAYAGLAKCYAYSGHFSFLPIHDAYPKARTAARKALGLDPQLAEANTATAFVAMLYDWDWSVAERGFTLGLRLNPNDGEAHVFYSWYLLAMGSIDKALDEAKSAVNVDPLSPVTNTNLGYMLINARHYDEGIEHLRKTLDIDPTAVHPQYLLGFALAAQGKFDESIRMLDHETLPTHSKPLLAWVYALCGRPREARKVIEKITASTASLAPSSVIAMAYFLIGDGENGEKWLERSYTERDSQLIYLRQIPLVTSLRSHPKLLEIHDRIGLLR